MRSVRGSISAWNQLVLKVARSKPRKRDDGDPLATAKDLKDFFQSPEWARLKASRLSRHPKCLLCPAPATRVHLRDHSIATLSGLNPHMTVTVCDQCGIRLLFHEDGRPRDQESSDCLLVQLAQELKLYPWLRFCKHQTKTSSRRTAILNAKSAKRRICDNNRRRKS